MSFMMTTSSMPLLLLAGLLLHPLRALAYIPELPIQTTTVNQAVAVQSWSPRPTEDPALSPQYIFARQNNPNFPNFPGDASMILVAPDNTCGYISGKQGAPFSCGSQYKCIFFSATSSSYGLAACCTSGVTCKIRSECVESAAYSTACDAGCQIDAFTLKCTASTKPFCARIQFSSPNIRDWWCVSTTPTATYNATTAFSGVERVYSTIAKSALWPVSTDESSSSLQTTATDEEDSSPTSDEHQTTPSPSDKPKSTSPAATIGGVVGGVIGAALLGIGAFFLWRRRKGQRASAPAFEPYSGYNGANDMPQQYPMNPVGAYSQQAYDPYKQQQQETGAGYAGGHQQYYDPQKPQELHGQLDPQELYSQPVQATYSELPANEARHQDTSGRTGNENDPESPFRDPPRR